MKKLVTLILAAMLLLSCVYAEDLGVQVIGGPNVKNEPLSLDDLQLGNSYTIDGYARVNPLEFLFVDHFPQWNKDANHTSKDRYRGPDEGQVFSAVDSNYSNSSWYFRDASWMASGNNADFIWLLFDVTNLQKTSVDFLKEATVKVVYAEEYEFAGWVRQINHDYSACGTKRVGHDTVGGTYIVLNPANAEPIDMMYTGTFVFGCTVPNAVVEDNASPLAVVINLGGNELTYHIRK